MFAESPVNNGSALLLPTHSQWGVLDGWDGLGLGTASDGLGLDVARLAAAGPGRPSRPRAAGPAAVSLSCNEK